MAPIEYLEKRRDRRALGSIDRTTLSGQRDYAMFSLMFNTGARVQEILGLHVRDVRFEPPCQVRLLGKGNKVRFVPIWPRTAKLLRDLIQNQHGTVDDRAGQPVFLNRQGSVLTRFGVRYLLRKYAAAGAEQAPAWPKNAFIRIRCGTRPPSIFSRLAWTSPPSASGSVMRASIRRCAMRARTSI